MRFLRSLSLMGVSVLLCRANETALRTQQHHHGHIQQHSQGHIPIGDSNLEDHHENGQSAGWWSAAAPPLTLSSEVPAGAFLTATPHNITSHARRTATTFYQACINLFDAQANVPGIAYSAKDGTYTGVCPTGRYSADALTWQCLETTCDGVCDDTFAWSVNSEGNVVCKFKSTNVPGGCASCKWRPTNKGDLCCSDWHGTGSPGKSGTCKCPAQIQPAGSVVGKYSFTTRQCVDFCPPTLRILSTSKTCSICVLPSHNNLVRIDVTFAGALPYTATFRCGPGSYANLQSTTCRAVSPGGLWWPDAATMASQCKPCTLPTARPGVLIAVLSQNSVLASPATILYSCAPGHFGCPSSAVCDYNTGAWQAQPTCELPKLEVSSITAAISNFTHNSSVVTDICGTVPSGWQQRTFVAGSRMVLSGDFQLDLCVGAVQVTVNGQPGKVFRTAAAPAGVPEVIEFGLPYSIGLITELTITRGDVSMDAMSHFTANKVRICLEPASLQAAAPTLAFGGQLVLTVPELPVKTASTLVGHIQISLLDIFMCQQSNNSYPFWSPPVRAVVSEFVLPSTGAMCWQCVNPMSKQSTISCDAPVPTPDLQRRYLEILMFNGTTPFYSLRGTVRYADPGIDYLLPSSGFAPSGGDEVMIVLAPELVTLLKSFTGLVHGSLTTLQNGVSIKFRDMINCRLGANSTVHCVMPPGYGCGFGVQVDFAGMVYRGGKPVALDLFADSASKCSHGRALSLLCGADVPYYDASQPPGRTSSPLPPYISYRQPRILTLSPDVVYNLPMPFIGVAATGGTNLTLTVYGEQLGPVSSVLVGDSIACDPINVKKGTDNATEQLSCEVPRAYLSSGALSISMLAGPPTAQWNLQWPSAVLSSSALNITAVFPRSAAPGSEVLITGFGFGHTAADILSVWIGQSLCKAWIFISAEAVICIVPEYSSTGATQPVRIKTQRGDSSCSQAQSLCMFQFPTPIKVVISVPEVYDEHGHALLEAPILPSSPERHVATQWPVSVEITLGIPSKCSFALESTSNIRQLSLVGVNTVTFNVNTTMAGDSDPVTLTEMHFPSIADGVEGMHAKLLVQCISQFGEAAIAATPVSFRFVGLWVGWVDRAFLSRIPPIVLPPLFAFCTTTAAIAPESFASNLVCKLTATTPDVADEMDVATNYVPSGANVSLMLTTPTIPLSAYGFFDEIELTIVCTWLPTGIEYSSTVRKVMMSVPRVVPEGTLRELVAAVVHRQNSSSAATDEFAVESALGIPGYHNGASVAPRVSVPVAPLYSQSVYFVLEFYDMAYEQKVDIALFTPEFIEQSIQCTSQLLSDRTGILRSAFARLNRVEGVNSRLSLSYQVDGMLDFRPPEYVERNSYQLVVSCNSRQNPFSYVALRSVEFFVLPSLLTPTLSETFTITRVDAMPLWDLPAVATRITLTHPELLLSPASISITTGQVGRCTSVLVHAATDAVLSNSYAEIYSTNVTLSASAAVLNVNLPATSLVSGTFGERYRAELTCYAGSRLLITDKVDLQAIDPKTQIFINNASFSLDRNITFRGRKGLSLELVVEPSLQTSTAWCHVVPRAPLYAAANFLLLGGTRRLDGNRITYHVQVDLSNEKVRQSDLQIKCEAWGRQFFVATVPLGISVGEVRFLTAAPKFMLASRAVAPLRVPLPAETWSVGVHFEGVLSAEVIECTADVESCELSDSSACAGIFNGESTVKSSAAGLAVFRDVGLQIVGVSAADIKAAGRVKFKISCLTQYVDTVVPAIVTVDFAVPSLVWNDTRLPLSRSTISAPWEPFAVAFGVLGRPLTASSAGFCPVTSTSEVAAEGVPGTPWPLISLCEAVYPVLLRLADASTCVASAEPSPPNVDVHSIFSASVGRYMEGMVEFHNLTVSGQPNSTYNVKVSCNYFDFTLDALTYGVELSYCPSGTQVEVRDMATVCSVCADGYFSDGKGMPCTKCPANTLCRDGHLKLVPGFYSSVPLGLYQSNVSDLILYACWNGEACQLVEDERRYHCAAGYAGPICGKCDTDREYDLFDGLCRSCGSKGGNAAAMVLTVAVLLITIACILIQHLGIGGWYACIRSRDPTDWRLDLTGFMMIIVQVLQDTGILKWFKASLSISQLHSIARYASWFTEFPFAQGNFRCILNHPQSKSILFGVLFFPIPLGIAAFGVYYAIWASHNALRLRQQTIVTSLQSHGRGTRNSVVYTASPLHAGDANLDTASPTASKSPNTSMSKTRNDSVSGSSGVGGLPHPVSRAVMGLITMIAAFILAAELPALTYHSTRLLQCRREPIDGVRYLMHDVSVVCGSVSHIQGVLMSVVTYVVILALVVSPLISIEKLQQYMRYIRCSRFLRDDRVAYVAELLRPVTTLPVLHPEKQYFLSIMRLRQIALVLVTVVLDDVFFQLIAALVIQTSYAWLLEKLRPSPVEAYERLSLLTSTTFWISILLLLLCTRAQLFAITTAEIRTTVYFTWSLGDMLGAAIVVLNVSMLVPSVLLTLKATTRIRINRSTRRSTQNNITHGQHRNNMLVR